MPKWLDVDRLSGVQRASIATVGFALLIALGVMLASDPDERAFAVAASVVASVIASFIALWINLVVIGGETPDDQKLALADRALATLPAYVGVLQATDHGLLGAKPKNAIEFKEWRSLLEGAQEELFIVGHALDKWCGDETQDLFVATIRRLVQHEKTVQLVALPPGGQVTKQLSDQRRKDYDQRIKKTLHVLADLHDDLEPNERKHLDVRALRDGVPMPYMVAGNERELITCSYPAAAQESGGMLAISICARTTVWSAIRDDLASLILRHSVRTDLTQIA